MSDAGARVHYEFAGFQLDIQQRLLKAGADRRPVPLPPKIFETLLYMVERRGELLDKNSLLKAIWPNVVVEENSLNQNISALRRALGENPGEHRFIVTEPGRGYRFVADVRVVAEAPTMSTSAKGAPGPDAGARPSPRKSVAVLPFANLTGDSAKEYFGDGLAEELIHKLARTPGVRVPSRTSSFAYKGRNVDVRQIARDLDAGVVLEGSVRSAGERIRITAQLIDGQDGFHLWSNSYDRKFEDLFELQDEIAQAIVSALRVTLGGQVSVSAPRATRNLDAYHLFLQANAMQASAVVVPTNVQVAYGMYQRAIELDPGFAQAYSQMAGVRVIAAILGVKLPGTLADAEREVSRALSLDPSLGGAYAAVGTVNALQGRWVEAEARFQRAFDEDSDDPGSRLGHGMNLLATVGHLRRYHDTTLEAHWLAPAWMPVLLNVAVSSVLVGMEDETHAYIRLLRNLGGAWTVGPISDLLGTLHMRAGEVDKAIEVHLVGLPPDARARGEPVIRAVYLGIVDQAHRATAVDRLDEVHRGLARDSIYSEIFTRRMLYWYTQLGACDRAYALLDESLARFAKLDMLGAAWGFLWMREMAPFREDARFAGIIERFAFMPYWEKFGPPDGHELRRGKLVCS